MRVALQQARLTGSTEPLLAALKAAEQRLARDAQPRLRRCAAPSRATSTESVPAASGDSDEACCNGWTS